jgi:predicted ATPase/DNA-binding SARP family transcriptional activator
MSIALRLLGPPAVRVGGRWEALPCAKPEAAFVYLACFGGRVRRAALSGLLWPDADEHAAQVNLRQTLRTLSARPWGAYLGRDRFTAWVVVDSDLAAFDRAVEHRRWAEAHTRYGGPLLAGFALDRAEEFDAWVASERAAAASRWRRATLAWVEEARATQRWSEALGACDRLLADDPLDEEVLRWALRSAAQVRDVRGVERRYAAFRSALYREVGVAPDPATEALVRELTAGVPSGSVTAVPALATDLGGGPTVAASRPSDMPAPTRRPIGRDAEIDAVVALLATEDHRLVTLLAPAGMGKTTLAAAVVEALRPTFGGEMAVVAVDRVEGPEAVARLIGRAVGISLDPAVGLTAQLVAGLGGRRVLLWLDGFEPHLERADLLADLVTRCPRLSLLVTSRVRLGVVGETVVHVAPLAVAPDDASPEVADCWSPAAQLFVQAAARVGATAPLVRGERDGIEDVCRRLGGHPLAIELAAAWTDVMPLSVLADRLEDGWGLLRPAAPAPVARQSDVEEVLWQSWRQLADEDRAAWARLALMPGTVERGAAAEIAGGWRSLRRLADRAIVAVHDRRVAMHALLARFGRERAAELGHASDAWTAALAVWRARVETEVDPESGLRVRLHPHDLDQAVGVWRHAVATADWDAVARMAAGLLRGLERVGRQHDRVTCARSALEALQAVSGAAAERAYARVVPFAQEPLERRRRSVERAIRLARRHGDAGAFALAVAARYRFDARREAQADFERARAAFERCGDGIGLAALLYDHGERLMLKGFVPEAEAALQASRALHHRLGDRLGEAMALDILTTGPLYRGDAATAGRIAALARALFAEEGAAYRGAGTLATDAWIAMLTGPVELVLERADAFARSAARFGDAEIGSATVLAGAHAVVGDVTEAVRHARRILELVGDERFPSIVTVLAHDRLAWGLARTGAIQAAARHLAIAVAMCRDLDAPRWVAQVAVTCGELALAAGRHDEAARLMVAAWHHPGIHELPRRRLVAPLAGLGLMPPPRRLPEADLTDEELLGRIEALSTRIRDGAHLA